MKHFTGVALILALLCALVPAAASAQDSSNEGLLVRIDGPVTVTDGDTVGYLIAIDGDVLVDGRVTDGALLISADTEINGTVEGSIIAIDGTLTLGPDAVVTGDISYNDTTFRADPAATIQGEVRNDLGVDFNRDFARFMAWLSLVSWAGTTVLLLLAGVVFAGIGRRQLWSSAALITRRPLQSILAALLLWIVVSFLAFMLFISILGIPVGLALVIVLVAIWGLGYVVAGTRIGAALTRATPEAIPERNTYLPTLLGIGIIQLIALLPLILALIVAYTTDGSRDGFLPLNALALLIYWSSGIVIWAIGVLGTGALAFYAWRAWQQPASEPGVGV